MRRFFGSSKPQEPAAPEHTLSDAQTKMDSRTADLEKKIHALDKEIYGYKQKMNQMRPGGAKNAIKRRALQALKRKKMYEAQRDQLMNQSFNLDQAQFVQSSLQDTALTVKTMEKTAATMKAEFAKVDLDAIYDMQDDMQELMDDHNEIQEALSRTYETPDMLDEDELEAELAALGDEFEFEEAETPDWLAAPPTYSPASASPVPASDPNAMLPSAPLGV